MQKEEEKVTKIIAFSPVTVDCVKDSIKDDRMQAQLRQVVTKKAIYPEKVIGNNKSSDLFDKKEFGDKPKEFVHTSIRIAWIDVPLGTTSEDVKKRLENCPKARIYQIVSTNIEDLLTDNQKYNISQGILDIELVKDNKMLRNKKGEVIYDKKGNPIYRSCFFSADGKEDVYNVETSQEIVETVIQEQQSIA